MTKRAVGLAKVDEREAGAARAHAFDLVAEQLHLAAGVGARHSKPLEAFLQRARPREPVHRRHPERGVAALAEAADHVHGALGKGDERLRLHVPVRDPPELLHEPVVKGLRLEDVGQEAIEERLMGRQRVGGHGPGAAGTAVAVEHRRAGVFVHVEAA